MKFKSKQRASSFFVGHGSPIAAIEDSDFTKMLKNFGKV